jgi:hypothetical protein
MSVSSEATGQVLGDELAVQLRAVRAHKDALQTAHHIMN